MRIYDCLVELGYFPYLESHIRIIFHQMDTFSTTIQTIIPNKTFTHMFLTRHTKSWSFFWCINIYPLWRFRIRKCIILILGDIRRNLISEPLLALKLVLHIKSTLSINTFIRPCLLSFLILLPHTTNFILLSMNHETIKIHVDMKRGCTNSFLRFLEMPITKWLISSLSVATKDEAYLDNLMNFMEYSLTQILL